MKIAPYLSALNGYDFIVQFDNEGMFLGNSDNNTKYSIYEEILKVFREKGNIRDILEIPEDLDFEDLTPFESFEQTVPFYGSRKNVITFQNEQEEFYSSISILHARLYRHDSESCIALFRLASFFINNLAEIVRYAVICIDANSKLIGFNYHFFQLVNDKVIYPEELLNKPVSEILSPSPQSIQDEAVRNITLPSLNEMTCLEEHDLLCKAIPENIIRGTLTADGFRITSRSNEVLTWPLKSEINWMLHDVCIEMHLAENSNLPCIVFGGINKNSDYLDRNGYFIGPDVNRKNLLFKKQGRCIFSIEFAFDNNKGGVYLFYRIGNIFIVLLNNVKIFSYIDTEPIVRESTWVTIYNRANTETTLRKVSLYRKESQVKDLQYNLFTDISGKSPHYLVNYLDNFYYRPHDCYFSLVRLQDLNLIQKKMETLQTNYNSLLLREQKMAVLLQDYRERESDFIGTGQLIETIRDQAEKVAHTQATTLITGATGTGKEVLARFIHQKSMYKGQFIKVDCSNLPSTLMESLLFGHEKGAFTGATEKKEGYFKQAEKGTLFLDEIHNLGIDIQAKLLQFLQDRTIVPVGSNKSIKLDLRIIVASNMSLEDLCAQGRFRYDLYYRIAVIVLRLPSLKERIDDIPLLTHHFIDQFNIKYNRSITGFSPEAYQKLYSHNWPGNIRELQNIVERACLFCIGTQITPELITFNNAVSQFHFQETSQKKRKPLNSIRLSKNEVELLVKQNHGVIKNVAKYLNVTRRTVYNFFEKHNIKPGIFKNINIALIITISIILINKADSWM